MYKFGQVEVASKDFNSVYQVTDTVDLEKIRVSEGVVANKHDTRFIIGYELEPGKIVPLYMKTPKDCASSGVSQYNEASAWKMGFNVSEDKEWVSKYEKIWWRICELMHAPGCGGFELGGILKGEPLSNEKYINPKLITWDGEIRTRFKGKAWDKPEKIGSCHATGVIKIGSVYRQGLNYHLQVFLKECKYEKRDSSFTSQLSDDDEEDYDMVN